MIFGKRCTADTEVLHFARALVILSVVASLSLDRTKTITRSTNYTKTSPIWKIISRSYRSRDISYEFSIKSCKELTVREHSILAKKILIVYIKSMKR
jgi:hypothetical protein